MSNLRFQRLSYVILFTINWGIPKTIQELLAMSQNNAPQSKNQSVQHKLQANREIIKSLKAQQDEKRGLAEKVADFLTAVFGSMGFLILNILWFAVWFVLNLGLIPGIEPFDPFPFGLLTMIVSLEAIALAIIVLISQNRSAKIADLREEVDLQVDMMTEREITKLLRLVAAIAEKQGIELSDDEDLQTMLEPTPMDKIEAALEKQVLGEAKHNHKSE
jgi:uncharacterized membrane protein